MKSIGYWDQISKSQLTLLLFVYVEAPPLIIISPLVDSVCLFSKVIPLSGFQCIFHFYVTIFGTLHPHPHFNNKKQTSHPFY
jgi:hypothetical protein